MQRRHILVEQLEKSIGGHVSGFYDMVQPDTICVLHERNDRYEIFLTRDSHDQLIGNHAIEISAALVELGYDVAVPVRYAEGGRVVPNGLKLVVTPQFYTTELALAA